MSDLTGRTLLQRYRIEKFLGRGGMADVYKVWDNRRSTYLAMKVLHQDLAVDRVFMRRFQREAQTLAKLRHPNIVRYYGLEREGRLASILLDYIDGDTLKQRIFDANGPMPIIDVHTILLDVTNALQFAHLEGFVHCDLKPSNIMFKHNNLVQITDFGVARMTDTATATMVGMGTPAYMAPELVRGSDPTPQTDIYALGIVLYETLTGGERPFTGEKAQITGTTSEKVRWEQVHSNPPSPRQYNPKITPLLEAVCYKCLEKKPVNRYASALGFLESLETALQEYSPGWQEIADKPKKPQLKPEPKNIPIWKTVQGQRTIIFGPVLLVGLFIFGYIFFNNPKPRSSQPAVVISSPVSTTFRPMLTYTPKSQLSQPGVVISDPDSTTFSPTHTYAPEPTDTRG